MISKLNHIHIHSYTHTHLILCFKHLSVTVEDPGDFSGDVFLNTSSSHNFADCPKNFGALLLSLET